MRFGASIVIIISAFGALLSAGQSGTSTVAPSDSRVELLGRYDDRNPAQLRFAYPGSGFTLRFRGTGLTIKGSCDSDKAALTVVIDHGSPELHLLKQGANEVEIAADLPDAPHTVEVYKRTETWQGIVTLTGIKLAGDGELLPPPSLPRRKLIFIGDSVTCGAGIENNAECKADPLHPASDAYDAYGMLLGRWLDAQSQLVCYGGRGLQRDYRGLEEKDGIVNVPQFVKLAIPLDAATERVPWNPKRWQPDAIVVSLGTNDFNLQKTKPLDQAKWVAQYVALVRDLRKDYPKAVIFLTDGAIVTNPLLAQMVEQTVAKLHNKKVKYVAGRHYPGNGCDAHPTRAQHVRIAEDLEPVIRQNLGW